MTAAAITDQISTDPERPSGTIGVVIPGFGHPEFLAEAIISACTQDCTQPVRVVVVDDGCRFRETAAVARTLMARFPGVLFYIRQENTRLPGARNTGVRFLQALCADLESVFFLDADNRLSPYSLTQYRRALGQDPSVGWAYPDISFFGLNQGQEGFDIRETAPDYCALMHLAGNISEAGSLVRASVFATGHWYDETMTSGFEDWDFWLTLLGGGYVGRCVADAGFFYRRRPESMLADSRRGEESLLHRLHTNHPKLFSPRTVMQLAHGKAPDFTLLAEEGGVHQFTDPTAPGQVRPLPAIKAQLQAWLDDPRGVFVPPVWISTSTEIWNKLQGLSHNRRWLFWQLRGLAAKGPIAVQVADGPVRTMHLGDRPDSLSSTHLCAFPVSALANMAADPGGVRTTIECRAAIAEIPGCGDFGPMRAEDALLPTLDRLAEGLSLAVPKRHRERHYAGPDCREVRTLLIDDIAGKKSILPYPVGMPRPRIMLAVRTDQLAQPHIAAHVTRRLQSVAKMGHEAVLMAGHRGQFRALDALSHLGQPVDDLVDLKISRDRQGYQLYLGHRLTDRLSESSREVGAVLSKSVDMMIVVGVNAFVELFGYARQYGIPGYLDLGHPDLVGEQDLALVLAFEHAIAGYIGDEASLRPRLSAAGVPAGKILSEPALAERLSALIPEPDTAHYG